MKMNAIRNFVLPAQVVLLFIIPALMLFIVNLVLATCITLLHDITFYEVTSYLTIIDFIMYVMFAIVTGLYMWGELKDNQSSTHS